MKKLLFASILLLVASCAVNAQQPTKKERIKYLFSLMGQDSMISKMSATMASYAAKSMKGVDDELGTSAYESARSAKTMASAMENVKEIMMTTEVDSYDKHFTSAEIEDFITFYSSKSGQKWVKETPAITSEMMMAMVTKNQAFIKKAMEEQQ